MPRLLARNLKQFKIKSAVENHEGDDAKRSSKFAFSSSTRRRLSYPTLSSRRLSGEGVPGHWLHSLLEAALLSDNNGEESPGRTE